MKIIVIPILLLPLIAPQKAFSENIDANLKIKKVSVIGSLCMGNQNAARVFYDVFNSSSRSTWVNISLSVDQGPATQKTYHEKIKVGQSGSYTFDFTQIKIESLPGSGTSKIKLKVEANKEGEWAESSLTDNKAVLMISPPSRRCATSPTYPHKSPRLMIRVVDKNGGPGYGGYGQGIHKASLEISRSLFRRTYKTDRFGRVQINNLQPGSYTLVSVKRGCKSDLMRFTLGASPKVVQVTMDCGGSE